jgi:hypothetical protein
VDESSIVPYSSSEYYVAGPTGVLPFRGYAAISVTNSSQKISIIGNNASGSLSVDGGGKYLFASDYGITPVHSVNDATSTSGLDCLVSGNSIVDARVAQIYHPQYHDPIAARGTLGAAVYVGNSDSNSTIWAGNTRLSQGGELVATTRSDFIARSVQFPSAQVPSSDPNALDDYEEGWYTATLTPAGGSITLTNNRLNYTKIGRLVTITGEINVSSVSSPTDDVSLNLPFQNAQSTNRSARTRCYVTIFNLSGGVGGNGELFIESLATSAQIQRRENFAVSSIGANVQAGTTFIFAFSYMANG